MAPTGGTITYYGIGLLSVKRYLVMLCDGFAILAGAVQQIIPI